MGALVVFLAVVGIVSAQGYFANYFSNFYPFYFAPVFIPQNISFGRVVFPQASFGNFNNLISFPSSREVSEVFISATLRDGVANALIERNGKRTRYTFSARDEEGVVAIISALTGFSKATVRNILEFRDLGRSGGGVVISGGGSSVKTDGGVVASITDRDFGIDFDEDEDINDLEGFSECDNMFDDFNDNDDLDDVDEDDVKDCQDLFDELVDEVGKNELDDIDGFKECDDMFDDFDKDEDLDDVDEGDFKDCEDFFDEIKDETIEDLR